VIGSAARGKLVGMKVTELKVGHAFNVGSGNLIPRGVWILTRLTKTTAELKMTDLPVDKSFVLASIPRKLLPKLLF
jgi:hypothetical protein